MPEQLTLEQSLRQRSDVHCDEGLVAARTEKGQRARDELLAAATLALHEHRAAHGRHLLDLHHHFAQRLALANQTGRLLQLAAVHDATHAEGDVVDVDGFHEQLDVPECAKPLAMLRIVTVHESDDGRSLPQQLANEADVRGICQIATDDDEPGLRAPDLRAHVVQRTHERGRDSVSLEPRVETDRRLDVVQRDQDGHL